MPGEDADPFGRAVRDWYRDDQTQELIARDGGVTVEHPIERFYFQSFDPDADSGEWLRSWLDGPLLDLGAGAGRLALYFQEQFETVAIETSAHLVATMRERGVEDAREADMFALREYFDRDRFRSAVSIGTQLGLAGSISGVRKFLADLAYVTTPDATVVLDSYDPRHPECVDLLGWRSDPRDGVGSRVFHFEYEEDVGETLLFRFYSPDRFREAVIGTGWTVAEVRGGLEADRNQWRIALRKPE